MKILKAILIACSMLTCVYSNAASALQDVNEIFRLNDINKLEVGDLDNDLYLVWTPQSRFENGLKSQDVELRYRVNTPLTVKLVQGNTVIAESVVLPEIDVSIVLKTGEGRSLYARFRLPDSGQVVFDGYLIKE